MLAVYLNDPVEGPLWEFAHLRLPLQEAFLALGCHACTVVPFLIQLILAAFVSSTLLNFDAMLKDSMEFVIFILHVKCSVWLGLPSFEYLHMLFAYRFMQVPSGTPEISIPSYKLEGELAKEATSGPVLAVVIARGRGWDHIGAKIC